MVNNVLDYTKLSPEIQNMYLNATTEYKSIIEGIFNPDVEKEIDEKDRPLPKYAKGTLDAHLFQGGMPIEEKPRKLVNSILSGNYRFVEIEGGVRGGKDIYALFAWSKYLMVSPDRVHLALGSSLEHVLRTVLMSNGFGIYFLIPHGVFVRETINGAQRGVYKFLDNYGLEKQILFYGNEKENDKNKFQGFTIGSIYVNETLNQHVGGLLEGNNRMASVRQPLMIMTQNPRGKAHPFYMRFESQRITNLRNIERMEFVAETYKNIYEEFEKAVLKDRDAEKRKVINNILKQHAVNHVKDLPLKKQLQLNEMLLDINYEFDKMVRDKSVEDFIPTFLYSQEDWDEYLRNRENILAKYKKSGKLESEDCKKDLEKAHANLHSKYPKEYMINKSMKKIVSFVRGDDNSNNVNNAYDFYYSHFTVDDNLSMSEMQKNDFKNTYAEGTSAYDQSVLGLRRSTDSALFSMFMNTDYLGDPIGNLMSGDPDSQEFKDKYYDGRTTYRVMSVDKGLNHPNGIIDADIDFEYGSLYQIGESLLDVKAPDVVNMGVETIYQDILRVIRERRNREMPIAILVDPSASELYIYLQTKGLPVIKASNEVFKTRGEESTTSNQTQDKDLIGIPLMQTAIAKFKFLIHEKCIYTREQLGSYEAPFDEKSGKEKVKKVNDDLVDPLRYIFNKYIRMSMWEGEISNDRAQLPKDDRTETIKETPRELIERLITAFGGEVEGFGESDNEGYGDFFGNGEEELW